MKRRFRQKQDLAPKEDPKKSKELSEDHAQKNVDIDDVIQEIDTHLEAPLDSPEEK
ncbi:MAG: ubiquitin-like protein Pup [Bacteroidales bacterium]|nr:ubiquitin-like protein Pup [Bacteroidales bacterium]